MFTRKAEYAWLKNHHERRNAEHAHRKAYMTCLSIALNTPGRLWRSAKRAPLGITGIIGLVILFSTSGLSAQTILFSYTAETRDHRDHEYRIDLPRTDTPQKMGSQESRQQTESQDASGLKQTSGSIILNDREVVFTNGTMLSGFRELSISPNRLYLGALFLTGNKYTAEIYRPDGLLVYRIPDLPDHADDDPSVHLHVLDNGSSVFRYNIASFLFYDIRGIRYAELWNSSGSPDGEAISDFSSTPFGNTRLLINPKIFHGNRIDSRIRMAQADGSSRHLAVFSNTVIESVQLHPSGRLILLHVIEKPAGKHNAIAITRDGTRIQTIDYENNEILEVSLSQCGRYITARASGRVLVHKLASGEVLGRASFGERVLAASYMPDGILAVMTGSISDNRTVQQLRAHMIHLDKRTVVREQTFLATTHSPFFDLELVYLDTGVYRLQGGNREILIEHTLR